MSFTSAKALFLLAATLAAAALAATSRRDPAPPSAVAIHRQTLAGVVWIHANGQGKGSGWVVDERRRWLITSYHVAGENDTVEVFFPAGLPDRVVGDRWHYLERRKELRQQGLVVSGKVLARRPEIDLALIEVPALPEAVRALRLSDRPALPGERVQLVGSRYDISSLWGHARGTVRQCRTLRDGYFNGGKRLAQGARVLEAHVPMNEGDSGGPLVRGTGEVVGVAAAVAWEHGGTGLFIDAREVAAFLAAAGGRLPHAEPPRDAGTSPGAEAYSRGLRSVVMVQPTESSRRASGWLVDAGRRIVLTTAEVMAGEKDALITFPAEEKGELVSDVRFYQRQQASLREQGLIVPACVLAVDRRRNLALLEVEAVPAGREPPPWRMDPPGPAEAAHALGSPTRLDVLWCYTAGWVRQRGHAQLSSGEGEVEVLFLQAPVHDGEGGGPLLDDAGALVGMVTGKETPQQAVSYALTAREIRAFLEEKEACWKPANGRELTARGRVFLEAGRYERAIADFTRALEAAPERALPCSERARAHLLLGNVEQALADAARAVLLDARLAEAHVVKADVLSRKGELKEALAASETALSLDRSLAEAWRARARAQRLLGSPERSLASCEEALWLDRKSAPAYLERGLAYLAREDTAKARSDLERALSLEPRLAEAHLELARLHLARREPRPALAGLLGALRYEPAAANAVLALAGRLGDLLDDPAGRALLEKGLNDLDALPPEGRRERLLALLAGLSSRVPPSRR